MKKLALVLFLILSCQQPVIAQDDFCGKASAEERIPPGSLYCLSQKYITNTVAAVFNRITDSVFWDVLRTCIAIGFLFLAYRYTTGKASAMDVFNFLLIISILLPTISSFSNDNAIFSFSNVFDAVVNGPGRLAGTAFGASIDQISNGANLVLYRSFDVAANVNAQHSGFLNTINNISGSVLIPGMILLSGVFFSIIMLFVLLRAMVLGGMLISIAPIIIPAFFFSATRNMGQKWLEQLVYLFFYTFFAYLIAFFAIGVLESLGKGNDSLNIKNTVEIFTAEGPTHDEISSALDEMSTGDHFVKPKADANKDVGVFSDAYDATKKFALAKADGAQGMMAISSILLILGFLYTQIGTLAQSLAAGGIVLAGIGAQNIKGAARVGSDMAGKAATMAKAAMTKGVG